MFSLSVGKQKYSKLLSNLNIFLVCSKSTNAVIRHESVIDSNSEMSLDDTENKRNKSRLNSQHRNIIHGNIPYSGAKDWFHKTVKYRRKLLGKYGFQSGVNPGIMWPTMDELSEIQEYERIAYPYTIQEVVKQHLEEKATRDTAIRARDESISQKIEKLEEWKEELQSKIAKKEEAALLAKAKKDRLVEEVRRHFGFKIDPRDERFKELLEKKEKEEKKKAKELRRKEREAKLFAKLSGVDNTLASPNG